MIEPRAGRTALLLAFGYSLALSGVLYMRLEQVPTLFIPVVASGLPLFSMTPRQGMTLRLMAVALLLLWVFLGMLSVGLFYLPAVVAMSIAHQRAKRAHLPGVAVT